MFDLKNWEDSITVLEPRARVSGEAIIKEQLEAQPFVTL